MSFVHLNNTYHTVKCSIVCIAFYSVFSVFSLVCCESWRGWVLKYWPSGRRETTLRSGPVITRATPKWLDMQLHTFKIVCKITCFSTALTVECCFQLFCLWLVNFCVLWMSLLREALAQHSGALFEICCEGIHMLSIQKVSHRLQGLKLAAKQHRPGNTCRWSS